MNHSHRRKFTWQDIEEIILARRAGEPLKVIAKRYNVHQTTISGIFRGDSYKEIGGKEMKFPRTKSYAQRGARVGKKLFCVR